MVKKPKAALALDLESVLIPEIWEWIARCADIPDLALTTREQGDYDALMRRRIKLCRDHRLTLASLQAMVQRIEPLPGALGFLEWAQTRATVEIVSDTFREWAKPVLTKLGNPRMLCNSLELDGTGYITAYRPRNAQGKRSAVVSHQKRGFKVAAVGDSHNDASMLIEAELGILFRPCPELIKQLPDLAVVENFQQLRHELGNWLGAD